MFKIGDYGLCGSLNKERLKLSYDIFHIIDKDTSEGLFIRDWPDNNIRYQDQLSYHGYGNSSKPWEGCYWDNNKTVILQYLMNSSDNSFENKTECERFIKQFLSSLVEELS